MSYENQLTLARLIIKSAMSQGTYERRRLFRCLEITQSYHCLPDHTMRDLIHEAKCR